MLDIYSVLTALFLLCPSPAREARQLTLQGAHRESIAVIEKYRLLDPSSCFFRAVNHFSLNDKEQAEKWLDYAEYGFEPLPHRYRVLVFIMRQDLKNWKKNDLRDISRDMKVVRDNLRHAKVGKQTQKIQKDIVDRLDKLIKQKEDAANRAKQEQSQAKGNQKQEETKPLDDSRPGGQEGKGQVDMKKFKETVKQWGKLPEKERAKAMVELTRGMPTRYREAIENYFRLLYRSHRDQP